MGTGWALVLVTWLLTSFSVCITLIIPSVSSLIILRRVLGTGHRGDQVTVPTIQSEARAQRRMAGYY